MALKNYKCKNGDCFASDIDDSCLLKKRCIFGYCRNYYPKIKKSDNEVFLHLFHHHNLNTRKYLVIAIIISTISLCFAAHAIVFPNVNNDIQKKYLNKITEVFQYLKVINKNNNN